ncbi:unnamed protein product [Caenorhabditis sp. 36 PRJEB53466]|nr:unnamed protein product [Caenorhabditis sp. 36 PRJEB53466]
MNEQEVCGLPATKSVQVENGKRYYYLDVPHSPPQQGYSMLEPDNLKLRKLLQLAEPIRGPLSFSESFSSVNEMTDEPQKYGDNMVVRNAREMFENVDILPDDRYFCRVCNRTYKTHSTLTAHLRGCHLRHESPCLENGCNHVSFTENERKKHQKIHDKKKARDYLLLHRKLENSVSCLPYPCEEVLREQILRTTKDIPGMKKTVDSSGKEKVKYSCLECDQTFANAYHATRHTEVHKDTPKRCFYCGEIRTGIMDLQVHYMRIHKNEGVHTFTCSVCDNGFTSMTLFRNHAHGERKVACRNLEMRQDIYYGELPAGVTIDQPTLNRLNFFRRRNEVREATELLVEEPGDTTVRLSVESTEAVPDTDSDIFDGLNSMIQTEFGLKKLADYKNSPQFRTRPAKRYPCSLADDKEEGTSTSAKKERVLMAQNGYYEHQASQQQNIAPNIPQECINSPPAYGYDPLIGRYPDFQPMQQALLDPFPNYFAYESQDTSGIRDSGLQHEQQEHMNPMTRDCNFGMDPSTYDPLAKASEMATQLLIADGSGDAVFEELNKLDFAMPAGDENECDDDLLTDLFGF